MRRAKIVSLALALCWLVLAATAGPVSAQAPEEKRVALVVGDGNYEKAPLPTAANDAGLIAQTLQAAGFDVIGARDLDVDGLRNSLRDFMDKVKADPANTVAMIYLSGYVVQLAGENYYIPVDAKISRETDIPIEGLRISDYQRQLAAIPVKASIIVLDAAGPQPFIEGGNPIAGGLALVEPSQNMMIAFSAAPGTVAPPATGDYGTYAQALAEMIRTGGLSLPEVFDRVRLRVSETSKGAQVPWDDHKITAPFAFFDRAPDAPPVQGSPDQVAAIRDRPLRDLGAQEAFTAALTRDSLQGYQDFLAAYASDPLAKRVRALLAARREAITWRRTYLADTPEAYWSYLRRYPQGPHAWDARRRLSILSAAIEPPQAFAMIDYDVPPPPQDEFVYVDRPVLYFDDPEFGFAPPPPPPAYFLGPPPSDFVVLAAPIAVVGLGLFLLPRPPFVAMPAFVRSRASVRPPPNNVIFNNIHNTTVINNVINNPAPAPAAVTAAGGGRNGVLGASLPAHVEQRATLIQQGKLPAPPSASINPRAAIGTPGAPPANGPSNGVRFRQELPRANELPGTKGAPPLPSGAPSANAPSAVTPGANRLGNTPMTPGQPNLREERLAPGTPNAPGRPPVVQGQPTPNLQQQERERRGPPTPSTATPVQPGRPQVLQGGPAAPNLQQERERRAPPTPSTAAPVQPTPPTPPTPRQEFRRETAPSPPPAPRVVTPPPAPRVAAPPPPPPLPRVAPPPPPRVAPPPPPRAAPPPPPRPAPPPPRPAPPPPPAAKKCPPNQPKC